MILKAAPGALEDGNPLRRNRAGSENRFQGDRSSFFPPVSSKRMGPSCYDQEVMSLETVGPKPLTCCQKFPHIHQPVPLHSLLTSSVHSGLRKLLPTTNFVSLSGTPGFFALFAPTDGQTRIPVSIYLSSPVTLLNLLYIKNEQNCIQLMVFLQSDQRYQNPPPPKLYPRDQASLRNDDLPKGSLY